MIVAVTGGKGGVGKSTIAYNLAAELDSVGRADSSASHPSANPGSVVVDSDLGMADLPSSRGPDLHDVLAGRADPHEAIREGGPVTVIPCGRTLAGARSADLQALTDVFAALERTYRWVVVDSPAGLHADVGLPLAAADAALLVTTPESAALADALRVRALARELDAGLCRVVLNRAGPNPATEAVADRFGAPAVAIPESEPLATAQSHGQPLRETAPDAPARQSLETLADAVYSCSSV
ncbi:septum site-determining protein MinD [Haloarcula mannanilytica]|uniref:Septum site-determining protein MinD n=1 Tax=Haloarcula mannanilytica TaxID=2509225 RepID=A0A4C2EH40_9EURY|nr:P-loop NTPase [Haloarcula mannanilytica]GCF13662.1 septum site-determining protein MinD [Haloarcula mannanilytica]